MNVFKSDGRYKHFRDGYHYIAEFHWSGFEDRMLFVKLREKFDELYGPPKEHTDAFRVKYNKHYRIENNSRRACRRIYLCNEAVISWALLKIQNGN